MILQPLDIELGSTEFFMFVGLIVSKGLNEV